MAQTKDLTNGSPLKLLTLFALPMMFGNMFQQLYTVVDTAIVGQGIGMDALAAIGSADRVNWLLIGIAGGYCEAFSVRISQKYGQKEYEQLKEIMGASVLFSIAIIVIGVLVTQLGLSSFLQILQVPVSLRPIANAYLRVILAGFPIVMAYNFCSACLRAVGNSKTPLYAIVVASVCNIILDYVAVFILKWGVAGAAAATLLSQCFSVIICVVKIRKTPELRFGGKHLITGRKYIRDLSKLGSPLAIKNIIIDFSGMSLQSVVNSFDTAFIAGYTAASKLYGVLELAARAYGYAIITYVGQNYGAKRLDRIKSGMKAGTILSVSISIVISTIVILLGRQIAGLFIVSDSVQQTAEAMKVAYTYICIMCTALPGLYLLFLYMFALQGLGNTIAPMVASIMEFFLRVGFAIFVGTTGLRTGVLAAEGTSWIASAVLLGIWYYHDIRKIRKNWNAYACTETL